MVSRHNRASSAGHGQSKPNIELRQISTEIIQNEVYSASSSSPYDDAYDANEHEHPAHPTLTNTPANSSTKGSAGAMQKLRGLHSGHRSGSFSFVRSKNVKSILLRTRSAKLHYSDDVHGEDYQMFRTRPAAGFNSSSSSRSPDGDKKKKKASNSLESVPAERYFDALEGPELEILKDSEEPVLSLDQKWPFLLRFPIACYGICLGLGSQTILWKALATSSSMSFLKVPLIVNLLFWCLTLLSVAAISTVYAMKCILYLEAVRREYHHPVRINFFFAPWIACLFLTLGIPPRIATTIHPAVWCVFAAPLLVLILRIHGQWPSGGERRLSNVANPSIHLSLAGYFVSAMQAAMVGWKEPALFFWAVGCAHYVVLLVTLYQRLPTAEVLPKELHPIFFLFVASPSAASMSWKTITGRFDNVSRITFFIALFLYSSLVAQCSFFCGFRFSIAWWAYTFPMTSSAVASIYYSLEVHHVITQVLAVILSLISVVTIVVLSILTVVHAVMGTLFPNDLAIAITTRRYKRKKKRILKDPLHFVKKRDEEEHPRQPLQMEKRTSV